MCSSVSKKPRSVSRRGNTVEPLPWKINGDARIPQSRPVSILHHPSGFCCHLETVTYVACVLSASCRREFDSTCFPNDGRVNGDNDRTHLPLCGRTSLARRGASRFGIGECHPQSPTQRVFTGHFHKLSPSLSDEFPTCLCSVAVNHRLRNADDLESHPTRTAT